MYAKEKPEKTSGLNGIQTHDLCDNGTVLYQLAIKPTGRLVVAGLSFCCCLNRVYNCDFHSFVDVFVECFSAGP